MDKTALVNSPSPWNSTYLSCWACVFMLSELQRQPAHCPCPGFPGFLWFFFLFLAFKELRTFVNFCNRHQFFVECSVSQAHLFSTAPVLKALKFKCHSFKEYGSWWHEAKLYVVHDDERIPSSFGIHFWFSAVQHWGYYCTIYHECCFCIIQ